MHSELTEPSEMHTEQIPVTDHSYRLLYAEVNMAKEYT